MTLRIQILLAFSLLTLRAQAEPKTLRVVPSADIVLLDPVFGTAAISSEAGLMVYESLFTWNAALQAKPEMAESWTTSPDGLVWTFTLRPNQRFHDGSPVTPEDVIASMQRWMGFDGGGARLAASTAAITPTSASAFEIRLTRPFPAMLATLAAAPSRFLAVMRAKDITPERKPITTAIGSGPFRYLPAERVSGSRVVWEKNPDYIPRAEPPDGMAGGRVVKVDRVEWQVIPDPSTVTAALQRGEVDFVETMGLDNLPIIAKNPAITIKKLSPLSNQTMLRANNLQWPFNDVRARQALNYVIDQSDELGAAFGDPANWKTCNAFYLCDGPYNTQSGAEGFHQDFARARALMAEAGYHGEKLVFIASHDNTNGTMSEVAADAMAKAGINVDMVWSDWATVVGRALNQGPVAQGGWNLRITSTPGSSAVSPQTNNGTDMSCARKNFSGWPCDEAAERLRTEFLDAADADRPALAEKLHRRLAETAPYRIVGESSAPSAWRTAITGVLPSPVPVYWNIQKP